VRRNRTTFVIVFSVFFTYKYYYRSRGFLSFPDTAWSSVQTHTRARASYKRTRFKSDGMNNEYPETEWTNITRSATEKWSNVLFFTPGISVYGRITTTTTTTISRRDDGRKHDGGGNDRQRRPCVARGGDGQATSRR